MNGIMFDNVISIIGFSTMLGGFLYVGRKLEVLDRLEISVEKIKNNLKVVTDHLVGTDEKFDHERLESYSPLRVTKEGERWLREIGFVDVFTEHENDFYVYIANEKPVTNYDIESAAVQSVIQLFERHYFAVVKEYFYNNPREDKGSFWKVAGVYVRNKYMEKQSMKVRE